jgi:hypothetical protein
VRQANAILHHAIHRTILLAEALNDTLQVLTWQGHASDIKAAANKLLWDPAQGMYRDNETSSLVPQDGNVWAVLSNLTHTRAQIDSISAHLAARWTPFGAPAPEAGDAVCPFISGLELQTHIAAGNVQYALALMRRMWGYMLDGPGMTNSTFIEGYAVNGSQHYQPYTNDPKISHAHGWASGPTSFLTFHVAGIRLIGPAGSSWRIEPHLGDLKRVDAGFATSLGKFRVDIARGDGNKAWVLSFKTPAGTIGNLSLENPECDGFVEAGNAGVVGIGSDLVREQIKKSGDYSERIEINGLRGGRWHVKVLCDEAQ